MSEMEEDQVNLRSQLPSPLANFRKDQALSRRWLGAEGSSVLPLSETEKKGAFINVDEKWKDDAGQELSTMGNICGRELCLWEEMSVQEFYQQQEEMTSQCDVRVTVRCEDRTQQELYHWEENMIGQYSWHEDDRCQECSQWEEDPTYQELSQREGEGYQDLSLLQDVRGHPHMYQLEVGKRNPQLSQVGDNSDKKLSQGKDYSVKELPQWEKIKSDQRQSQQEESVSSQRLCQWGGVRYKTWGKPLQTKNNEDAETCAQQSLSSSSSKGTKASGQQPEEQRDLEQSIAAELKAAAPAERKKRLTSAPLSPSCLSSPSLRLLGAQVPSKQQEEEADRESSLSGQELQGGQEREKGTLAGEIELYQYDDEEDSEISQQEMNKHQEVSEGEAYTEQDLSPGEAGSYQELSPGEASTEQELSPGEAGSYQELCPGEACMEQELSPGEIGSYQEWSQGEDFTEQELYPEESRSYLEFSDWDECTEKGLFQEVGSSQKLSDSEEYSEQELSPQVSCYQELSDWEKSTGRELSEEEESIGQKVSKGNINTPSMQSSWENDSDKELM
ncbi:unnamed protein product [Coccothraustes coccothraustes]